MTDATTLAPAGSPASAQPAEGAGEPAGGHGRSFAWVPGAVLLAGLALALWIVAAAGNVDLHALHLIHADGAQTHEVTVVYLAGLISQDYNPFVEDRLRALTPLLTIVYFISVFSLGSLLVRAIRGSDQWPRVVRLLAGFLPGYLMVLAPLQIVFAAAAPTTAAWIALVAAPVVALALHRRTIVATATNLRDDAGGYRRAWLAAAGLIGLILLICGVHRIQAGRYFMVPDSISVFLQAADAQLAGQLGQHLAQWDQQSDEWVFNAPLMFSSHGARDQLFAFWCTQFVGLASFGALVFGIVHSVAWRRRALAGALAAAMVLVSTPALHPWNDISLVGGQNPTLWLGHPGRLISIIAPWIAVLLIGRTAPRATIAILLATAGLAFTTIDGPGYTIVAVICAAAWLLLRGRGHGLVRSVPRVATGTVVQILALAALATPLLAYYGIHHSDYPDNYAYVLVGGAGLAMLAAIVLALVSNAPTAGALAIKGAALRYAMVAGALGIGFVLSNNLVSKLADGGVRRALGHVLPGYDAQVLSRGVAAGKSIDFPNLTGQECAYSGHCISFPYFLAVYGFTIILGLAGWLALGRYSDDERVNRRRAAWLVTIAAFSLAFAILDFTGQDIGTAWVLTRFVEVPYYAILAFAALALSASRSRFTLAAGAAVMAAWTVIPFVGSHVPEQLYKNADWLIARVG